MDRADHHLDPDRHRHGTGYDQLHELAVGEYETLRYETGDALRNASLRNACGYENEGCE